MTPMTDSALARQRRAAAPDRHQGHLARSSCWRPASRASRRSTRPSTPSPRPATTRARARGQGRGTARAARRAPRPAARPADRHQGPARDRRAAHHLRLAALPRFRAERDAAMVALVRKAGAIDRRQDQRAGVRRRRQHAQPGVGRDRQPVRSDAQCRRLVRRLGAWRSPATCCRSAPAPTPAARCAFRPPSAAWSASARRRAWCRWICAALGWTPISVLGPMGRTVADTRLLFSAQIGMDDREPLAFPLSPDEVAAALAPPISAACASPGPRISANARSTRRSARSCATRMAAMRHLFRACDEVASTSARPTAAST